MERMTAGKFRHLPVVEETRLLGIISIGDVVKYRVQKIEFESAAPRDYIRTAQNASIPSQRTTREQTIQSYSRQYPPMRPYL